MSGKFFEKPEYESDLQSDIIDFAHLRGWFAVKIVSPSIRGMMDVVAIRKGRTVWMEVKRDDEPLRAQQAKRAREMQAQGAEVHRVDNMDAAREILR